MTTLAQEQPGGVTGGVDTHKDVHVAAVLDGVGRLLGTESFPADRGGYRKLLAWMASFGAVQAVGVEGTGSWGAGLARFLTARHIRVVEVNRPNRQNRRRRGKSDPLDAEAAARAVLSGQAAVVPKAGDGPVEALRQLRVACAGAIKARTAAANQLHSLCDTAPENIQAKLRGRSIAKMVATAERWPAGPGLDLDLDSAATQAIAAVARRWRHLDDETRNLKASIDTIVNLLAPALMAVYGVGPDTAGQLLVTAGDNPERLRHESSFAALCGASPVPASSGRTTRHRLNRGGDRHANSALWIIVRARMAHHQPTRDYVERRTAQGLTKREIMRCLKRYVARELFPHIQTITTNQQPLTAP
jgi:transposase